MKQCLISSEFFTVQICEPHLQMMNSPSLSFASIQQFSLGLNGSQSFQSNHTEVYLQIIKKPFTKTFSESKNAISQVYPFWNIFGARTMRQLQKLFQGKTLISFFSVVEVRAFPWQSNFQISILSNSRIRKSYGRVWEGKGRISGWLYFVAQRYFKNG